MKQLMIAIRFKILMLLLLGLIYPFAMTALSQALFNRRAGGDVNLIAQKFESPKYFWPRPSAVDYNPIASGGSNLGPLSKELEKVVNDRLTKLRAADASEVGAPEVAVPPELLFASASGIDPDISPPAADYQVARISKIRGIDRQTLHALIVQTTQPRDFRIFGEPRINVLALNLALDKVKVSSH